MAPLDSIKDDSAYGLEAWKPEIIVSYNTKQYMSHWAPLKVSHIWLAVNGATVRPFAVVVPGSLCSNYKFWMKELGESGELWL